MKDSRVEIVEQLVLDAMGCRHGVTRELLVRQAVEDWTAFADEFPATDSLIGMVTTRLTVAGRHTLIGNDKAAGLSLQLALNGIKAVCER